MQGVAVVRSPISRTQIRTARPQCASRPLVACCSLISYLVNLHAAWDAFSAQVANPVKPCGGQEIETMKRYIM
jgi:hypothetical protein